MGCGHSQVGIAPKNDDNAPTSKPGSAHGTPTKQVKIDRPRSKTIKVKENDSPRASPVLLKKRRERSAQLRKEGWTGSTESLQGKNPGERGGSATSKMSHHSTDSGFEDKEYQGVVTENSSPDAIKEVEEGFNTPRDLDLGVVGKPCPQRLSAKDKERLDEQRVMASLQSEGLIQRPVSRAGRGLAFEIVMDKPAGNSDYLFPPIERKPPARLEKLEKKKKRRKKMTLADIEAKLEKAESRRKQQEQDKLEKIQAVTNKSDVQNALDAFASMQQSKEEQVKSKEEIAALNREKRLREMRDKLRAKQEHAERVRMRKQMEALNTDKMAEESSQEASA